MSKSGKCALAFFMFNRCLSVRKCVDRAGRSVTHPLLDWSGNTIQAVAEHPVHSMYASGSDLTENTTRANLKIYVSVTIAT